MPSVTSVVLNVGFYNFVVSERILALIRSDSAPLRRMVQEARKSGTLIDATQGRKTKSIVFLDGGMMVASALSQETLARRLGGREVQSLLETSGDDLLEETEAEDSEDDEAE